MSDLTIFQGDSPTFEDMGIPNGTRTWREADVMTAMGYETPDWPH